MYEILAKFGRINNEEGDKILEKIHIKKLK